MAEENMVFIFKKNLILNKCLKFMVIKACMKLAYIDKYINLKATSDRIRKKVTEIKQSLKVNANSKDKTKYHQLNQQLESLNKKIAKTEQLIITDGTLLDLAALFIYNNQKCTIYQVVLIQIQ